MVGERPGCGRFASARRESPKSGATAPPANSGLSLMPRNASANRCTSFAVRATPSRDVDEERPHDLGEIAEHGQQVHRDGKQLRPDLGLEIADLGLHGAEPVRRLVLRAGQIANDFARTFIGQGERRICARFL